MSKANYIFFNGDSGKIYKYKGLNKISTARKSRYYINKSNVSRTLVTIVGTITFSRTYYQNKFSNSKFFYLDKCFELPKYDHYDSIIKSIAIDKTVHSSQAQAARDTSVFINDISYYMSHSAINDIPRQSIFNWIKNIALLADGGTWIKTGLQELRLDENNSIKFYLCEFHFKQAIYLI